jgi:hypothetical protein
MEAGEVAAWASIILAVMGGTWHLSSRITRLGDHIENHDKWHKERIERGADAR